jgi:hypothetical protein
MSLDCDFSLLEGSINASASHVGSTCANGRKAGTIINIEVGVGGVSSPAKRTNKHSPHSTSEISTSTNSQQLSHSLFVNMFQENNLSV